MSTTKEILVAKNMDLFTFRQPSTVHDIYVVGIKQPDPADTTKKITVFIQKSKPNAKAIAAGVKASDFIHTSFKPVGTIKIDTEYGEEVFSGPKKAQIGVTFQSAQPDLYTFISKAIEAGEYNKDTNPTGGYVKNGEVQMNDPKTGKTFKRPQILLKKKMKGKIIAINVPEYVPHNMDADGNFVALSPVTLDPTTGRYAKKPVTLGSIRFFADDEDLDLLQEAAARIVDKRVRPWVVDKTTLTVTNPFGNTKVLVTDPLLTGETPEDDEDAAKASLEKEPEEDN